MVSKSLLSFLISMMLVTGVCNTLLTKYQDNQCVRNCEDPNLKHRQFFEQPVIQTAQMFIGEMGCWIFVGGFWLYRRFIQPQIASESNGYEAVSTNDGDIDDTDGASIRSNTPLNPVVKTTIKEDETRRPLEGWKVCLLALPAICDICGTTLMNVGLLFVVASIYQMTRGALVLFVGVFSVVFLKHKLQVFQWLALVTVVVGVGIVGLAGALYKDKVPAPADVVETTTRMATEAATPEAIKTIIGIFLIAGAQIFTATQFVVEEFILEQYAVEPLKLVGWEGLFGFLFTVLGMLVGHLTIGRTAAGQYGYFDVVEGLRQITSSKSIGISSILIMFSIGGFNFFGLSVTRTVSATSRSTIDTCRTLFIWIVSLGLGWETFKWLQVVGFAGLVYGTFLFNGVVPPPLKRWRKQPVEQLLPEEPIEHV